jgi:hypothetical protein
MNETDAGRVRGIREAADILDESARRARALQIFAVGRERVGRAVNIGLLEACAGQLRAYAAKIEVGDDPLASHPGVLGDMSGG